MVDEARWPWRGSHWAHLVSDSSLDELHEVARRLGKRRLGFQGDHYDVDVIDRERALGLGVEPVGSRELVRRLRTSGLRRAHPKPRWRRLASSEPGVAVDPVLAALASEGSPGGRLVAAVESVAVVATRVMVGAFADERRMVVLLDIAAGGPTVEVTGMRVDELIVGAPRADGEHSIEAFVDR
jgi:hypothetical protein